MMIRTLEKKLPASSRDEARWQAFVARDASFEGRFYIAVKTTGVYCRPGCPARLPKRANVRFFDTRNEAERAGFRPCKRCKPDQPSLGELHAGKIAQACRLIETADEAPKLDDLAADRGLEPLSLPPHLQAGARCHAEGLRHGASGEPRARGVWAEAEL